MMAVEEGDVLMQYESGEVREDPASIMDRCIDNPRERVLHLYTFCLAMGNAADAVEIMCIGFIMTELNVSQTDKEFLSAAVFFGMFFGGLFCGVLSDKFGRRPCLLYSLALNTVAGLISAIVPSVQLLIFCRVIGGIGIGGSVPAVFSLGAEIFASQVRGRYLSVIASFWMVGAIFVGAAAWIMLGSDINGNRIIPFATWRMFAVVCSLPAFSAFLLTLIFIPESPRFLVGKLEFDRAAMVLNKLSVLKTNSDDLRTEYYKNSVSDEMTLEEPEINDNQPSIFSVPVMFKDKTILNVMMILMVIWFTLSFGSYGISTWISTIFEDIGESNPYEDSFIFAAANLPGNVISILFVDEYGRKNLLFFGMFFSAFCSIGFAIEKSNKSVVVLCAALFNAFSVIGWNSLDCLSVEMFPTGSRTSAMGFLAGAGRLGAISAQFINGSLEKRVSVLLLVTSSCMIVGGSCAFFLPDDRTGHSLDTKDKGGVEKDDSRSRSEMLTPEINGPDSHSGGLEGGVNPMHPKNTLHPQHPLHGQYPQHSLHSLYPSNGTKYTIVPDSHSVE